MISKSSTSLPDLQPYKKASSHSLNDDTSQEFRLTFDIKDVATYDNINALQKQHLERQAVVRDLSDALNIIEAVRQRQLEGTASQQRNA